MSVSYDLWWGLTAEPGLRGIVAYRLPRDVAYKLSISVAMRGMGVYMLPRKRLLTKEIFSGHFIIREGWRRTTGWRISGGPCVFPGCTGRVRYPFPSCPKHRILIPASYLAWLLVLSATGNLKDYLRVVNDCLDVIQGAEVAV